MNRRIKRRAFLQSLSALLASPLMIARIPSPGADEIVLVDGWIVRRSQIAER